MKILLYFPQLIINCRRDSPSSLSHKRLMLYKRCLTIISFHASKMANFASVPKHGPNTSMWEYGQEKTPNKMKISAWNVNGIRSVINKGQLQQYIKHNDPDIICINQTKICYEAFQKTKFLITNALQSIKQDKNYKMEPLNDKKLGKYYQYWNFCKVSSGYSGVLTLSKFKPIKSIQDFPMDHHMSLQGRCITLQYDKFYILNCYKPNSGSQLQRLQQRTQIYDVKFAEYIKQLKKTKKVIVCGDMNVAHKQIDIARPKANTKTAGFTKQQRQSFGKLLKQCGLVDSYRYLHPDKVEYTWWSNRSRARQQNIGWRIDYILSTDPKILKSAQIIGSTMGSDHCPVECVVQF